MEAKVGEVLHEEDDLIEVTVGVTEWQFANGQYSLEEDYRVDGEVWRVHKNDPDPYPSNPHAHCIGGARRRVGCKLHLGTGELFSTDNKALGKFLSKEQFERLINLIKPKFPGMILPIPS